MTTATRLPGIYFETATPATGGALPRMDIAAFAGFTPSGPVDLPFTVEDIDRFHEIFGKDLALAWDRRHGVMETAQLPAAVRAFFRNGGRRCWVIRLANGGLYNTFVIPGLLAVDPRGDLRAGLLRARSEGSWSDGLTVNATLLESAMDPGSLATDSVTPAIRGLAAGEVAQAFFPGTVSDPEVVAYFEPAYAPGGTWFRKALPSKLAACGGSPPPVSPDAVFALDAGADRPIPFRAFCNRSGRFALLVSHETGLSVPPGVWLRVHLGNATLLMQVESLDGVEDPSAASPSGAAEAALMSTRAWWTLDAATAWVEQRHRHCELTKVTFELWVRGPDSPVMRMADLGFAPGYPRFCGYLPTDAALFAPVDRPQALPGAALRADADHPRFPLAGNPESGLMLPLGITGQLREEFYQGANLPGLTALDRDGLSNFGPGVFLDPNLQDSSSSRLLEDAFFYQYQNAPVKQAPRRIHAVLPIGEVSLLAVPDATHRGWQRVTADAVALLAPDPLRLSPPGADGTYAASWTAVPGAGGYTLQESADPQFEVGISSWELTATSFSLQRTSVCPSTLYYRVSARGTAGRGPWSITAKQALGTGLFRFCEPRDLNSPIITLFEERNRIVLQWTTIPNADGYALQVAGDPSFESARLLYQGNQTSYEFWKTPGAASYFRVAARQNALSSAWSNTVRAELEPFSPWEVLATPNDGSLLLAIHTGMLRLCGARGDLIALLSLPSDDEQGAATAYVRRLQARVFSSDDQRLLTFGAVYHPWAIILDALGATPTSLKTIAPDGAIAGSIASRTIDLGAWIAPANQPLNSVVALTPTLETGALAASFATVQINLIAQTAYGFIAATQDTLSTDPDLVPLNVRRLLVLIRRLALREGQNYVFQNNGPALQRRVARRFEYWMRELLARGAFSGLTPEESFRVVVGTAVNTQNDTDQGRFIVELRIAPSLPMRFLTVRLVQSGGELSLQEL